MVTVGTLEIKGVFKSKDVVRGLKKVKSGFKQVAKFGKSVMSDMQRMVTTGGRLRNILSGIGLAGAGAFIGLAKGAPAVAPAMAQITVQTERLKRALGTALQPVFDKFSEGFTKFVNFVEANPDVTKNFVLGAGALAGVSALTKLVGALTGATIGASVLSALGYIAIIGTAAFGGLKLLEGGLNSLRNSVGMGTNPSAPTDMSFQTLLNRLPQQIVANVRGQPAPWEDPNFLGGPGSLAGIPSKDERLNQGFDPTPSGMISAWDGEQNRRFFLLEFWDNLWS